jgi:hypothetical protein
MAYLCALLIKINGGNVTTVIARIPGVLLNLCAWCAGVAVIKKFMGKVWSVFGAFLLGIMPYFISQCRFGLDCNLLVSMLTISVFFLICAIEKKKTMWYFVTGILWGLTYYTYTLSYIPNTLGILVITVGLLLKKKINWKQILAWWIPVILLGLPLFGMICVNQFQLETIHILGITLPRLPEYRVGELVFNIETILANIKTEITDIFCYDWLTYNSFPDFYNFYKISVFFLAVGLACYYVTFVMRIVKKSFHPEMILGIMWLLYFCEGMILGGNGPNINKLNGLMFFSFYFVVYGIRAGIRCLKKMTKGNERWSYAAAAVIGIVYLVSGIQFADYYFNEYPTSVYPQVYFDSGYEELLNADDDKKTYIECTGDEYIYFLYSLRPNPYDYNLPERTSNEYENYVLEFPLLLEYDASARYIIHDYQDVYKMMLEESGFSETEHSGKYVVYEKNLAD